MIEFICAGSNKTLIYGHHLCQVYHCHTELHLTQQQRQMNLCKYNLVYIYYINTEVAAVIVCVNKSIVTSVAITTIM